MDRLEAITTRRSVRKWTDEPVSVKDVKAILCAAMSAPSAGNEQAWQFVVVNNKELLKRWSAHCRNVSFLAYAPIAVLVCRDIAAEKYAGYSFHDCCAASENILLGVHSLGLGGVWGNVFDHDVTFIQDLFGIPENIIPFSVIPFGHFEENIEKPVSRFDSNKIHWNSYGERG